ncbi:MAG: hypothetical protein EOO39_06855 [Cytophagaceae bacterium]|nr:MAG: hypothetical protein EOO39_06855 [Cytophagaceae bacterium]
MAASSASSDGSQQANLVSNENAETMFGADQAETNMVKLVDGKLTPMGDTDDDVMDEQLRNRYSSDEERSLQGYTEKTYENSDASLRGAEDVKPDASNDAQETTGTYVVEDNGPATQDDDNTFTLESDQGGAEDEPATTSAANDGTPTSRIQSSGADQTNTYSMSITGDMMPPMPGTPDPNTPMPGGPETPPTPPSPGPEIPDLPGSPSPDQPEITEPSEDPGRSHEINAGFFSSNEVGTSTAPVGFGKYGYGGFATRTSTVSVDQNHVEPTPDQVEPGEAVPGTQYVNMSTGIDDAEGMESTPDTGEANFPYKADGNEPSSYKPGERPEEVEEMMTNPRQAADESLTKAQEMIGEDADRSDAKSTEGLDLPYNDPQSVREHTKY